MASNTINFTQSNSSGSYIDGKIVWTSTADTSANNSDVTAKIYVCKGSTTETLTVATEGTWSYSITINEDTKTGTASKSVLTSWIYLGEYTVKDIDHGSDGKKSITISGSISAPSGTSYAGKTTSGSGIATFDTISRPSTLTFLSMSGGDLSGTLTYKFTAKSTSFYNRANIALNINGSFTTIKSINIGKASSTSEQTKTTTFSSSELSTIYNALPNTANAKVRVTLRTYSDSGYSTEIGSGSYLEFESIPMPASVKPTASLSVTLVNNNTWIKSKSIYVAGYSGLKATLTAAPGTGAKMSSYAISGGGYSSNTSTLTVGTLTTAGSLTLTGTAKDSRGRTNTASKTITILPYSKPKITQLIAERGTMNLSSGEWTPNDSGTDLRVEFVATTSLVDKGNTYTAVLTVDGDSSTISGCSSNGIYDNYFFSIGSESTVEITLKVTDQVGQYSSVSTEVSTMPVTMEFNSSGQGIAFGKTSEKDAFECAWPMDVDGRINTKADLITGNLSGKYVAMDNYQIQAYDATKTNKVDTALHLNQWGGDVYVRGYRVPQIQHGAVTITPSAANTPTGSAVKFDKAFSGAPRIVVNAKSTVPGTSVIGIAAASPTSTGFTAYLTRNNTNATGIDWIAIY